MSFHYQLSILLLLFLEIQHSQCNKPLIDAEIGADGKIPELVIPVGDKRFYIVRKRMTQADAMAYCEKANPTDRLAVFPDFATAFSITHQIDSMSPAYTPEYDVKDKVTEFGRDRRYWIGLVDWYTEGEWTWLKSGLTLDYDFWIRTQPDHIIRPKDVKEEHCVTLWNPNYKIPDEGHTFNDENCLNEHYFICENVKPPAKKGKRSVPDLEINTRFDHNEEPPLPKRKRTSIWASQNAFGSREFKKEVRQRRIPRSWDDKRKLIM